MGCCLSTVGGSSTNTGFELDERSAEPSRQQRGGVPSSQAQASGALSALQRRPSSRTGTPRPHRAAVSSLSAVPEGSALGSQLVRRTDTLPSDRVLRRDSRSYARFMRVRNALEEGLAATLPETEPEKHRAYSIFLGKMTQGDRSVIPKKTDNIRTYINRIAPNVSPAQFDTYYPELAALLKPPRSCASAVHEGSGSSMQLAPWSDPPESILRRDSKRYQIFTQVRIAFEEERAALPGTDREGREEYSILLNAMARGVPAFIPKKHENIGKYIGRIFPGITQDQLDFHHPALADLLESPHSYAAEPYSSIDKGKRREIESRVTVAESSYAAVAKHEGKGKGVAPAEFPELLDASNVPWGDALEAYKPLYHVTTRLLPTSDSGDIPQGSIADSILQHGFRHDMKPTAGLDRIDELERVGQRANSIEELVELHPNYLGSPPEVKRQALANPAERKSLERTLRNLKNPAHFERIRAKRMYELVHHYFFRDKDSALHFKEKVGFGRRLLAPNERQVLIRVLPSPMLESTLEESRESRASGVKSATAPAFVTDHDVPPEQILSRHDRLRGAEAYRQRLGLMGHSVTIEQAAWMLHQVRDATDTYSEDGV
jgi:hypothetical protein